MTKPVIKGGKFPSFLHILTANKYCIIKRLHVIKAKILGGDDNEKRIYPTI